MRKTPMLCTMCQPLLPYLQIILAKHRLVLRSRVPWPLSEIGPAAELNSRHADDLAGLGGGEEVGFGHCFARCFATSMTANQIIALNSAGQLLISLSNGARAASALAVIFSARAIGPLISPSPPLCADTMCGGSCPLSPRVSFFQETCGHPWRADGREV